MRRDHLRLNFTCIALSRVVVLRLITGHLQKAFHISAPLRINLCSLRAGLWKAKPSTGDWYLGDLQELWYLTRLVLVDTGPNTGRPWNNFKKKTRNWWRKRGKPVIGTNYCHQLHRGGTQLEGTKGKTWMHVCCVDRRQLWVCLARTTKLHS